MNAKRGYYSLIQFCPDASRAETVNLGVLLFCPELRFIEARTARANRRAAKLVGWSGIDGASLNAAKRAIERRLQVDRDAFQTLEDLQQFVDTRANVLRLTPPRPVKVFDPAQEINRLFDQLVGGQPRAASPAAFPAELDQTFRELYLAGRATLNLRVNVPIVQRNLRIAYAYRNGVHNLVQPKVFSSDEGAAILQAQRLAVDGDLLAKYGTDDQGKKRLVVIAAFESGEHSEGLESRVTELFTEYRVDTIHREDLDAFLKEVKQEAHA